MSLVNPDLRSRVTPDGAVILDINRDAMITLNPTGAYIWESLARGLHVDVIVADLACDTGTDLEIVLKDVHDFMNQMKSRNLIIADEGEEALTWRTTSTIA